MCDADRSRRRGRGPRRGFTLLELLIALSIMTMAMAVVIAAFVATLKGWRKGGQLLDELHHGDFVMEQMVSSLRSMAYFYNNPEKYGFWMEDEERGKYPTDFISFVTSGTAFVPMTSPLANGLHRLEITIDENEEGENGVLVRAIPHLVDPEEYEGEPWFVSEEVQGLDVRFYSMDTEDWEDQWEDTNAIPSLVEITLFMHPLEEDGEPYTISRVVEIPLGPVVQRAVEFREGDREDLEAAEEDEAAVDGTVGTPVVTRDPAAPMGGAPSGGRGSGRGGARGGDSRGGGDRGGIGGRGR